MFIAFCSLLLLLWLLARIFMLSKSWTHFHCNNITIFFFVLWSMFSVQQLRLQVQFTTRTNTVLSTLNSVSVSVWFMNMTTTTPTKKNDPLWASRILLCIVIYWKQFYVDVSSTMFASFFFRFCFAPSDPSMSHLSHFFVGLLQFKLPTSYFLHESVTTRWRKKIAEFAINAFAAVIRFAFINCDGARVFSLCCSAHSIFWNASRTLLAHKYTKSTKN